ncbi:hypothetical protein AY601_4072 [Pedobacter cryoconitis]|uniref:Uncharacterized protein n=1 Tax=Pedobacter cryoconitis TaxID=188932 RepID=A0A127VHZ5_9SPHI|nr:hypothetical protein [Pedobacter cryoconitis]AMQ00923.1 hypothetical protein AY601_4072 [Pedobacter cryoconitis]
MKTIFEIIRPFNNQRPKSFGEKMEEMSYPVSAVLDIAEEYADQFIPKWIPCKFGDPLTKGRYMLYVFNQDTGIGDEININITKEVDEVNYFFATHYYKIVEPGAPKP